MLGVVIILVVLFILGPIGLFVAGALWSALNGWLLSDDADKRAGEPAQSPDA
jgi:hypothetical protein